MTAWEGITCYGAFYMYMYREVTPKRGAIVQCRCSTVYKRVKKKIYSVIFIMPDTATW